VCDSYTEAGDALNFTFVVADGTTTTATFDAGILSIMKRFIGLLFILCWVLNSGTAIAQYPKTDTFPKVGPLSPNWTSSSTGAGVCTVNAVGQIANDNTAHDWYVNCMALWKGHSFPNGEIARLPVVNTSQYNALIVNGSGTNGYAWATNNAGIGIMTNGRVPAFVTGVCPTITAGDQLGLAYIPSTFTLYCINYTQKTMGSWVDTAHTYKTGSPGVFFNNGGTAGSPLSGPFQADCFPYSCNSVVASPYSSILSFPVIDYYTASPVTVTLTANAGWTIVYTTDGSTPTASSGTVTHGTTYTVPFTISTTGITTVKTIATKSGSPNSIENDYLYNVGYSAPKEGGCQLFPSNSIFNTPINSLPVQTTYNTAFQGIYSGVHIFPDFYNGAIGGHSGGIPYNINASTDPTYSPTFLYADQSDPGPYHINNSDYIENTAGIGCQSTPGGDTDYHLLNIVVGPNGSCHLEELYQSSCTPGTSNKWTADAGAIWDLTSNALRPDTWTSADAAGLPIVPLLIKYDEAVSGVINHPLRFTMNATGVVYLWPARHQAGKGGVLPTGARIRLKASFDISGFSPMNQVILKAMQTYGMFEADNGRNGYFQGVSDPRWNGTDLNALKSISMSNFEVVDESGLMMNANSQQIKALTGKVY
jgi:Chitobiase/beta-hexosaminidase C-terminal domain